MPAFTDSRGEPENDTIAKSGMTGLFWGWWRLVSAPALRLGSGTGWWWDCIFFVVDDEGVAD